MIQKLLRLAFIITTFIIGYGTSFTDLWSPIRLLFIPLFPIIGFGIVYNTIRLFYEEEKIFRISLIWTVVILVTFFWFKNALNYYAWVNLEDNVLKDIDADIENQYHLSLFIYYFLCSIIAVLMLKIKEKYKNRK